MAQKQSQYSEKLKDPRWQKKRLEILERDGWCCRGCSDKDTTLHVHHIIYLPKVEPWDIPSGFLVTLCENCHHPSCTISDGNCENCEYYPDNCSGPGDIPGDLLTAIGTVLNDIWKKDGDFLDVLYDAHKAIEGK